MEKPNCAIPRVVEIDLNKLTLPELTHEKQQIDQVCVLIIVWHADRNYISLK